MKPAGNSSSFNWVLTITLVALAVLCVQYYFKSKELRSFQTAIAMYQSKNAQLNMLSADLREYSKTHPAIVPLLESVGILPTARGNPATGSSAKPSTK